MISFRKIVRGCLKLADSLFSAWWCLNCWYFYSLFHHFMHHYVNPYHWKLKHWNQWSVSTISFLLLLITSLFSNGLKIMCGTMSKKVFSLSCVFTLVNGCVKWVQSAWTWILVLPVPYYVMLDRHFHLIISFFFLSLFIYFWLCWVFVSVRGLSLVVASGGHSSSRCAGLSPSRPLLLRSTGSRRAGSAIVAHGPSCSAACGILPDQGSNPCPLHWQADSQPLCHQGSPYFFFFFLNILLKYSWLTMLC